MLMEVSATLVLAGLVLVLVLLFSWGWRRKDVNLPPGPRPLPLLGNLMQLDRSAPFKSILELSKSYGPVMTVYVGPQRCVVLVGYETLKEAKMRIFQTELPSLLYIKV